MPEHCRVCAHPELALIDERIEHNVALSVLAKRFELPTDSLSRHRAAHVRIPNAPIPGIDPQELLTDLKLQRERAEKLYLSLAGRAQLDALREARAATESIAKLSGAYKQADQRHLLMYWSKVKSAILTALEGHPEAREAVLNALDGLQNVE